MTPLPPDRHEDARQQARRDNLAQAIGFSRLRRRGYERFDSFADEKRARNLRDAIERTRGRLALAAKRQGAATRRRNDAIDRLARLQQHAGHNRECGK